MLNFLDKILKLSKNGIANSLNDLFNACIDASVFPSDFKMARISPIFNSDDQEDVNNYRHISVLHTVARVFERLIYEQLYSYFEEHKLLSNKQWGFKSICSTALALSDCSHTWTLTVDREDVNSNHTNLSRYNVAVSMVTLVHLDILSMVCHRVPFWAHSYS